MSKEIIFKSACPAAGCDDNEVYYWYHDECPSWSNEYLSDQAKIRCDYCGSKWDFFNSTFECSQRKNKFKKSNLKRVLYCIAALNMANELSLDFSFNLQQSLKEQWNKYS